MRCTFVDACACATCATVIAQANSFCTHGCMCVPAYTAHNAPCTMHLMHRSLLCSERSAPAPPPLSRWAAAGSMGTHLPGKPGKGLGLKLSNSRPSLCTGQSRGRPHPCNTFLSTACSANACLQPSCPCCCPERKRQPHPCSCAWRRAHAVHGKRHRLHCSSSG